MRPPEADKKFFYGLQRLRVDTAFFTGKKSGFHGKFINTAQGKGGMASAGPAFKFKTFKPEEFAKGVGMEAIVREFKTTITKRAGGVDEARIEAEKTFYILCLSAGSFAMGATDPIARVGRDNAEALGIEGKACKTFAADEVGIYREHHHLFPPHKGGRGNAPYHGGVSLRGAGQS